MGTGDRAAGKLAASVSVCGFLRVRILTFSILPHPYPAGKSRLPALLTLTTSGVARESAGLPHSKSEMEDEAGRDAPPALLGVVRGEHGAAADGEGIARLADWEEFPD